MVRLVFRPYTQVRRTICTSVSLRASTRVSSGFTLLRHSSPSFGSQQVRSYSNLSKSRIGRSMMRPPPWTTGSHLGTASGAFTFILPPGFRHPKTRAHVRLLGPCFKTGRTKPFHRQRPWRMVRHTANPTGSRSDALRAVRHVRRPMRKTGGQPKKACAATPRSRTGRTCTRL